MKKKIIKVLFFLLIVSSITHARLKIRANRFSDRVARCCADQRGWYEPNSAADAEDEVNRLRMEIIDDYDSGVYMAKWQKKRDRLLEIQTRLGYTVPQRYRWGW